MIADDSLVPVDDYHALLVTNVQLQANHTNIFRCHVEDYDYDFNSADFSLMNGYLGEVS